MSVLFEGKYVAVRKFAIGQRKARIRLNNATNPNSNKSTVASVAVELDNEKENKNKNGSDVMQSLLQSRQARRKLSTKNSEDTLLIRKRDHELKKGKKMILTEPRIIPVGLFPLFDSQRGLTTSKVQWERWNKPPINIIAAAYNISSEEIRCRSAHQRDSAAVNFSSSAPNITMSCKTDNSSKIRKNWNSRRKNYGNYNNSAINKIGANIKRSMPEKLSANNNNNNNNDNSSKAKSNSSSGSNNTNNISNPRKRKYSAVGKGIFAVRLMSKRLRARAPRNMIDYT